MALSICLKGPVAVEEEWTLKLGLIETDELGSVPAEDLVHLPLLLLGVDAPDIVVHDRELVALLQYLLRTSIGTPSMLSFLNLRTSSWSLCTAVVCRCVGATSILSFARSMFLRRGTLPLACFHCCHASALLLPSWYLPLTQLLWVIF